MECRFGHDFSRVRVHSDAGAHQAARDLRAQAYTMGHDIVFGPGRYDPDSAEGRRLLGHELSHVIQQEHGGAGRAAGEERVTLVPDDHPSEQAAEAAADAAMAGCAASEIAGTIGTAAAGAIQRWPWDDEPSDGAGSLWNSISGAASAVYEGYQKSTDFKGAAAGVGELMDMMSDASDKGNQRMVEDAKGIPVLEQLAEGSAWFSNLTTQVTSGAVKGAADVVRLDAQGGPRTVGSRPEWRRAVRQQPRRGRQQRVQSAQATGGRRGLQRSADQGDHRARGRGEGRGMAGVARPAGGGRHSRPGERAALPAGGRGEDAGGGRATATHGPHALRAARRAASTIFPSRHPQRPPGRRGSPRADGSISGPAARDRSRPCHAAESGRDAPGDHSGSAHSHQPGLGADRAAAGYGAGHADLPGLNPGRTPTIPGFGPLGPELPLPTPRPGFWPFEWPDIIPESPRPSSGRPVPSSFPEVPSFPESQFPRSRPGVEPQAPSGRPTAPPNAGHEIDIAREQRLAEHNRRLEEQGLGVLPPAPAPFPASRPYPIDPLRPEHF